MKGCQFPPEMFILIFNFLLRLNTVHMVHTKLCACNIQCLLQDIIQAILVLWACGGGKRRVFRCGGGGVERWGEGSREASEKVLPHPEIQRPWVLLQRYRSTARGALAANPAGAQGCCFHMPASANPGAISPWGPSFWLPPKSVPGVDALWHSSCYVTANILIIFS